MTKSFYITIALLSFSLITFSQEKKDIVKDLNATKMSQGKVVVYQDDVVEEAMFSQISDTTLQGNSELVKTRGYRIAVFSDSRTNAKREAESLRDQIRSVYPDIEAVISYQSPRWRLRVGNYATQKEAEEAIAEMKNTLSKSLTREMKVVSDIIKRPSAE